MLSWLASGEHEAVQVETLQLFNLRTLLFPKENAGDPAEPPSPALLQGGPNALLASIW